jgi:acyl-coenzyme A thioesterase PaaI-like protein
MRDGPAPTPWSQLLAGTRVAHGTAALDVTNDWLQGRTVFGGLQAAVALRAMRDLVPDAPLRTLQGTFLAPVPGGTLTARAQVLRTGKSATHVEARIVGAAHGRDSDAATLAVLIGVFGTARASKVTIEPRQPAVDAPKPIEFGFIPGVTPEFTRHFKVRWLHGLPPYSGDTQTDHVLEVGLRDPGPATESHVLAMADFIPPVALSHLRAPAPGSTLTWMIELLTERFDTLGTERWRIDAQLAAACDGYTSQSVMVWGPRGEPVAMSRQSMVVFG